MRTKIILLLIIVMVASPAVALTGQEKEEENEVIFLIRASLGNRYKLSQLFLSQESEDIERVQFEGLHSGRGTIVFDSNEANTSEITSDNISGLAFENRVYSEDSALDSKSFLLISTYMEDISEMSKNEFNATKIELTGFSLKSENFEFSIDSVNSFSWDSKGWMKEDFQSFFSDTTENETTMTYFGRVDGDIYIQLVTDDSLESGDAGE